MQQHLGGQYAKRNKPVTDGKILIPLIEVSEIDSQKQRVNSGVARGWKEGEIEVVVQWILSFSYARPVVLENCSTTQSLQLTIL